MHLHRLLSAFALLSATTQALTINTATLITKPTISPLPILASNLDATNNTTNNTLPQPLGFLGVQCYHLSPAKVDRLACEPLFTKLFERGNVYEPVRWWNRWRGRAGREPCTIEVVSKSKDAYFSTVSLSLAQLVSYAIEVLDACQETGTGGANTFQGDWQVVVTRDPIRVESSNHGLSEE